MFTLRQSTSYHLIYNFLNLSDNKISTRHRWFAHAAPAINSSEF